MSGDEVRDATSRREGLVDFHHMLRAGSGGLDLAEARRAAWLAIHLALDGRDGRAIIAERHPHLNITSMQAALSGLLRKGSGTAKNVDAIMDALGVEPHDVAVPVWTPILWDEVDESPCGVCIVEDDDRIELLRLVASVEPGRLHLVLAALEASE